MQNQEHKQVTAVKYTDKGTLGPKKSKDINNNNND